MLTYVLTGFYKPPHKIIQKLTTGWPVVMTKELVRNKIMTKHLTSLKKLPTKACLKLLKELLFVTLRAKVLKKATNTPMNITKRPLNKEMSTLKNG